MAVKIRPIVLQDAASYRQCYDSIARERRYRADYEAPSLSEVRKRLRGSLREKTPFLVAVDGERVVGWAAVSGADWPTVRGAGHLGINLLAEYRGMGLGTALGTRVLKIARSKFESVFAFVYGKNKRARRLAKKMGFDMCGGIRRAVKLAYGFDDCLIMQKRMRRHVRHKC